MKKISIFLTFFIILAPVVEAVPIVEIFVDEDTSLYEDIMNNEKTETITFENTGDSNSKKTDDINNMTIEDIMDDI